MKTDPIFRAQKIIDTLQSELNSFRQDTYKTVHDDVGSSLSTASIKAKLLADKNPALKASIQDIHLMIKESIEHVTQLNKKLKPGWVLQGPDLFFHDLQKETAMFDEQFNIQVTLDILDDNSLKRLNFSQITLLSQWIRSFLQNALARLTSCLTIRIETKADVMMWSFTDDAPIALERTHLKVWTDKFKNVLNDFELTSKKSSAVLHFTVLLDHD